MQTPIYLALTVIGWGLYHIFVKLATKTLPAPAIQIVSAICGIVVVPIYYSLLHKSSFRWNWIGGIWSVAAFLSTAIGTLAYIKTLETNNVSQVVGYATTYPIFVAIIAVLFLGESFSMQKFIGLLLVVGGVFVASR